MSTRASPAKFACDAIRAEFSAISAKAAMEMWLKFRDYAEMRKACLAAGFRQKADFDSQEFYELCQDYRNAPRDLSLLAFEALQAYCKRGQK